MQLTFHYRQVPEEIRPVMVEKAKKIIAENGFKVKMVETADVMYTYFFLNTLVISLKHHCISHGEVYSVKYIDD